MFGGEKPDESQLSEAAKGVTACSKLLGDKKFIAGNNVTIAGEWLRGVHLVV